MRAAKAGYMADSRSTDPTVKEIQMKLLRIIYTIILDTACTLVAVGFVFLIAILLRGILGG